MATTHRRSASSITGPFRGSEALADNWMTHKQLRSPLFTRLFQDVYLPAAIPLTHEMRCRGAACLAPQSATLTGASATTVYGYEFVGADHPVELVVDEKEKFTAKRGIHIRRCTLGPAEGKPWHGIQLATPLRATLDLLCNTSLRRSLPHTVGLLDNLLATNFVSWDVVSSMLSDRHDNGIVQARTALGLADPRSESIPESEVRVWLASAGLRPELQVEVFDDDGTFLGRLDLAFPAYRIAVEYDGKWHNDPGQAGYDQWRRSRLRARGWHFIVVDHEWLRSDPRSIAEAVKTAKCQQAAGAG